MVGGSINALIERKNVLFAIRVLKREGGCVPNGPSEGQESKSQFTF